MSVRHIQFGFSWAHAHEVDNLCMCCCSKLLGVQPVKERRASLSCMVGDATPSPPLPPPPQSNSSHGGHDRKCPDLGSCGARMGA